MIDDDTRGSATSGNAEAASAGAGHGAGGKADAAPIRAGKPLEPGTQVASWDAVADALRTVYDPEIPVNIFELGLIYNLDVGPDGKVKIDMTLTAPACPVAGSMPGEVAQTVADVDGVGEVEVNLVWDPPWTPAKMSDDARMALDMP